MFLAVCQGLGLGIAVGLILGVVPPPIVPGWRVAVGAAARAVVAAVAHLSAGDEPLWPTIPVGGLGAGLAALVARAVAAGAARRQGDRLEVNYQAVSGVTAIVVLFAVVIAGVSL